ncbi:unnamed protein product, partial [Prorocentrum cordatum]
IISLLLLLFLPTQPGPPGPQDNRRAARPSGGPGIRGPNWTGPIPVGLQDGSAASWSPERIGASQKLKGTPAASSCPAAWPGAPRRELPDQHLHQRGPGGAVNQGGERPRSPSTGIAALSPHAGEHRWRAWTP